MTRLLTCICLALLAACGQESAPGPSPSPTSAIATTTTAVAAPADPELARVYAQTCKACHAVAASGAPLTGDRAAWQPRVAQGLPTLLEHTVNGYKGMPPLGACMDCSEQEFEGLIRFMAGLEPG
jgi:cytochrome c5